MRKRLEPRRAAVILAAAAAAAYATSFAGIFQFDDTSSILENPTLRRLWPPTVALCPPAGALTVSGRPILNLSFAVNFAISGYRPWSYHAFNLLIHVCAALALFGVVRRTLARMGKARAEIPALAASLLWVVHPLTTEAVTYIAQRAESLMALFYLLTLYGFIRGLDDAPRRRRWFLLAWLACLLGVGTKEVIVSAPAAVYLYDRIFVSGSWAGPWRARKRLYLALLATWIPLVGLVAWTGWTRGATSGFDVGVAWWPYWRSQGEAVARYLWLSFWPHPLVIDYGPSTAPAWLADVLFGLLVAGLAAIAAGCLRGRPWAFLGAVCAMVLAPTSVIPGVLQFVSEHRMYLPLAAVMTGAAVGAQAAAERLFGGGRRTAAGLAALLAAAVACLGTATARRNLVYRTGLGLWLDTVAKRPRNEMGYANVGDALLTLGRTQEAIAYSLKAASLDPLKFQPHYNLGLAYEKEERWREALVQYALATTINPRMFYADFRAGRILDRLGRPAEAAVWLRQALKVEPAYAPSHASLGVAFAALGRTEGAIGEFRRSLALDPNQPEVEYNLGLALAELGNTGEAEACYAAAVRLDPKYGDAELNLGVSLAQLGRLPEAVADLRAAVRLLPASPEAHANLALALDQDGKTAEAIAEFRAALRLRPGYAEAHYNLGNALLKAHDLAGAWAELGAALRLKPDFAPAREMRDRLAPYLGGP